MDSGLSRAPASTLGNQAENKDFDYPVQTCLADHHGSKYLDADGCHASAQCPSAAAGRNKKHNYVARVIARMAKEAGLRVNVEPDTYGLLLGEFSKAECRKIFPKHISKHYRDKFQEVLDAIELVASPTCTMTTAAQHLSTASRHRHLNTNAQAVAKITHQVQGLATIGSLTSLFTFYFELVHEPFLHIHCRRGHLAVV